ncbi:TPA: hypothetical protein ACG1QB_001866 [Enterobacter asburiae]|jgi:hypothetical protein|uniref:hypothetical protein n=1 Tax=Enterobacter asburiae TaxID=61645 RepID=UPI001A92C45C|nr:hypothetical protein [Enterobacter asburiae]MDW3572043.1 hypothetical protein [Enterobacter asburiae]BCT19961.1 hypothetical protein R2TS_31330 [Enterobacter asburiae]HCR1899183.1 hypothetical protein [Enterobacter asburiae]HCR2010111.1 hypothetical protein [Enterobacter asburiae]HCR2223724.1 hypothetical protein [Enterobacter asburiae]
MKINADQVALLNSYSSNSYASELVKHCKSIFPLIYDSLHEKTLRTNIAKLIETAGRSKVTQRGPLQLYFDMAITLGSEFETDPMYSDFSFEPDQFPTKNQLEISYLFMKNLASISRMSLEKIANIQKTFLAG